jgi:hypothetical protein
MRSSSQRRDLDEEIMSLPAKFGGLGLLRHSEVSPHAFSAAMEAADQMIEVLFGGTASSELSVPPQKARCLAVFTTRAAELNNRLTDHERAVIEENSSKLGRKWLSVIPFSSSLSLSNQEISVALYRRTLCPGDEPMCRSCGLANGLSHEELCTGRANFRLARHEIIKYAITSALGSTTGASVEVEPSVPGSNLRTDFRVSGATATTGGQSEYDLTVVSLASAEAAGSSTSDYLARIRQEKIAKYGGRTATPFHPLVLSSGGIAEERTLGIFKKWSRQLSLGHFNYLVKRISCILVQSRARVFAF